MAEPQNYFLPNKELAEVINGLKSHGKKTFLVSAFGRPWLEKMMEVTVGDKDWDILFEVICTNS